jgi:hypothetical protein
LCHTNVWEEVAEGTVWTSEEGSDRIMENISLRFSVFIIVDVIRMIELRRDGCGLWHLWERSEIFDWESERKRI